MKRNKNSRKKAGVSAVIGVILMVAIVVAVAATVYVYVNNLDLEGKEKEYSGILYGVEEDKIIIGDKIIKDVDNINSNLINLLGKDVTIVIQHFENSNVYKGVYLNEES